MHLKGRAMPVLTLLATVHSQTLQPQESHTLQQHICPSQRVQGHHFQCPKEIRQSSTLHPYSSFTCLDLLQTAMLGTVSNYIETANQKLPITERFTIILKLS